MTAWGQGGATGARGDPGCAFGPWSPTHSVARGGAGRSGAVHIPNGAVRPTNHAAPMRLASRMLFAMPARAGRMHGVVADGPRGSRQPGGRCHADRRPAPGSRSTAARSTKAAPARSSTASCGSWSFPGRGPRSRLARQRPWSELFYQLDRRHLGAHRPSPGACRRGRDPRAASCGWRRPGVPHSPQRPVGDDRPGDRATARAGGRRRVVYVGTCDAMRDDRQRHHRWCPGRTRSTLRRALSAFYGAEAVARTCPSCAHRRIVAYLRLGALLTRHRLLRVPSYATEM